MLTNADITIYNHKYNKDTRFDEWLRTVIEGVHFYGDYKITPGENGVNGANIYKLRIPRDAYCTKDYMPPEEYVKNAGAGVWTLQKEDIIVLGICDMEIERPAEIKKSGREYCTIMSFSDNRYGGQPHWRIAGV